MRKFAIVLTLTTLHFLSGNSIAQSWMPMISGMDAAVRDLYTDTINNLLYAGGNFKTAGGISARGISRWNGFSWDSLSSGMDDFHSSFPNPVFSIQSYSGKLFVGGSFTTAGGVYSPSLAVWDSNHWVVPPFHVMNGSVDKVGLADHSLYIGGTFTRVDTFFSPLFCSYNDSTIIPLSLGLDSSFGGGDCIVVFDDKLFAGGNLLYSTGRDLIVWDSVSSFPLANGIHGGLSFISCMAVFQNVLYIAGSFRTVDGNLGNNIMKWDGMQLSDVGGGADWPVWDMKVYRDNLYVCGDFDYVGGIPASKVAKWDGISWSNINNEIFSNNLNTLEIFNDHLVVGGGFTSVGSTAANHIAIYSQALKITGPENQNSIQVFPNPTVSDLYIKSEYNDIERVQLINIFEKEIYSDFIHSKNYKIDISSFPAGIYFLEIIIKNGVVVKKIIKQ